MWYDVHHTTMRLLLAHDPKHGRISVMIHLTAEMSDLINNALANGTPCILATASSSGQPTMSYRGSFMVFDGASRGVFSGKPAFVKKVLYANRYGTVWYSRNATATRSVKVSPW
jgi:hypothetical protein